MPTELEINLPEEVPVMTLPKVAFFPQALLPLHIFEPRYRQMIREVLASNRLMAVAGLNPDPDLAGGQFEPPHRIAGIGLVRACQKNGNGTSNVLLQGLCRVEIVGIVADKPYRRIRIKPLVSAAGATDPENRRLRKELVRLLGLKLKFAPDGASDLTAFLKTVEDPETFVDIAAFNLCENPALKQQLLETLDVHRRLQIFARRLRAEIEALRLRRRLQGKLADDRVSEN